MEAFERAGRTDRSEMDNPFVQRGGLRCCWRLGGEKGLLRPFSRWPTPVLMKIGAKYGFSFDVGIGRASTTLRRDFVFAIVYFRAGTMLRFFQS